VADEPEQAAGHAGLFFHLTESGRFEGLTLLELALGEGPVLVEWPVHHGDLERSLVAPDDEPAGRLYDLSW
jgi:hypothetical protein